MIGKLVELKFRGSIGPIGIITKEDAYTCAIYWFRVASEELILKCWLTPQSNFCTNCYRLL